MSNHSKKNEFSFSSGNSKLPDDVLEYLKHAMDDGFENDTLDLLGV